MKSKKIFLLITILVLAIISMLISSFISKTNTDTRSQAASTPTKLSFPKDHIFHSNDYYEWWYLNLLIRTEDKERRDTGYVISFDKNKGKTGLLTSKYDGNDNKFSEKTYNSGTLTSTLDKNKRFTISYYSQNKDVWLILKELSPQNRAKRYSLEGYSPEVGTLKLIFTEKTVISEGYNTPLLWGCDGKISVFKEKDTFYYSIPDLDITGTVKGSDGLTKKVKAGKAWMDHQWFNSSPQLPDSKGDYWIGHYWTGHHLTQRSDFAGPHTAIGAVTQIYKNGPKYSYWVKRNPDGTNSCGIGGVDFQVQNKYDNGYPSQIKVSITDKNNQSIYSGTINPFSKNQVFKSSINDTPVGFFEPMSFMSGTLGKENVTVTGLGFLETGIGDGIFAN